MRSLVFSFTILASFLFATITHATSLRVAPVVLDLRTPTASSTLRVWNDAKTPVNVQVRVFRWAQKDGQETYVPTKDVVVSPPITTLRPGGENIVRVVRTSKRPVTGEESYRLVVDELPGASRKKSGTVTLVVRHSIPLFFANPEAAGAEPSWTVQAQRGGVLVSVRNTGSMRLKVSNLSINSGGRAVAKRDGLVGYVLGNSSASWFVPGSGRVSGRNVTISADSETGRFDANARLVGG
ncbi:molecular chaperone [Mesorhizobium sp. SB112]|uniref:fimbrial biogenesis chaperone n=1 Tax=Mesorhizobium sp. SB112 TaxID=3151853 RepID=UPI0032641990